MAAAGGGNDRQAVNRAGSGEPGDLILWGMEMNESVSESLKALVPLKFRPALRAIYKRIYYFGLKYKCNYCNSNLRTFLPSGFSFPVLKEKKVVGGGYR